MAIKWVELTENHLFYFETAMKLYDQAFPIEVREPQEVFLRSLRLAKSKKLNNFHFLIGLECDQLVSFATGHYFANVNTGFIVYIVTNPHVRSNGLGTKTLLKIEELLNKDSISAGKSSLRGIILETETQEMVHTEKEKEDCIKRNRFFLRNNYEKYDEINYLQPALHDEVEEIPLNLFIKNLHKTKLSKEEVKEIIYAIYKEKYSLVNEIDKNVLNHCLKKMEIENVD
ncbi:GNAT family N-acetyltransferase [Metabacillus halosaccharovorans]|uniref:GNAT family N-acetyltransferase n=1 Tax=Metabacillus halosaccharovorans TaxID=930124 RepID=UPI001C1F4F8B|nr:GNAT family N-acetyltransferase [Metabacillus halosaccharovorans]MBU7592372.1 GNAT family N-acetyltransferase [Metabacillus halosaccharovorans]